MEPTDNDRLAALTPPGKHRLDGRNPVCSWCGRGVEHWGDTCDELCWQAWVDRRLDDYESGKGDQFSTANPEYPPSPDFEQPWCQ